MRPIIDFLLDIDGTVGDFTSHSLRVYGWSEEAIAELYANWPKDVYWLHDILGVSKTQFFKKIDAQGPVFWETIPEFSWAKRLTAELAKLGKVTYCTSPGLSPDSAYGKMKWMAARNAGTDFILTSQKHLCAGPNAILLDDHAEMCNKFNDRGGTAFLIPQPWNGFYSRCREVDIDCIITAIYALVAHRKAIAEAAA